MESKWKDKYATLEDYYKDTYGKTYKILDPETMYPLSDQEIMTKRGCINEFPCMTLEPMEITIDPDDDDSEKFTVIEQDLYHGIVGDSPDVKKWKLQNQREEIRKCIKSFSYFCHKYIKIVHPMGGLVPFILYDYQRRVIKEYAEHKFTIISKFRQAGLTTVTAIWCLWLCMFKKNQIIMLMSKTDREAMTAATMVANAVDWLPTWLQPQMGKDNDHNKEFRKTGSRIDFQGPSAARSRSLTYMILDEAAHIPEMEKHWAAMSPTLFTGGSCIALSTVNGLGNWYQEQFYEAKAKKNRFHVIELDFWENPDYNNPIWVADQKAILGKKGWDQEVLRSFLGSGETYIPPDIISTLDIKTRDIDPIRIKFAEWNNEHEDFFDEKGALWIWREPVDGHEYTMAVDAADGVKADNSVFEVIDNSTMEQVAEFYSDNIPPHLFCYVINEIAIYYNTCQVVIEAMAPAGGAVLAGLKDKLMYENLYYDTEKRMFPGIKTNSSTRPMVLESLQHTLMQGERGLKINSPRLVHELKTFKYNASKKRAEADKGKHDDAVMAISIAIYIRNEAMKGIPVGADVPKELTDVFRSEMYEKVRQEIKDGLPENWIEEEEDFFDNYVGEVSPGIIFNTRRRFNLLLKEFNW